MSSYTKLTLAAAALACREAEIQDASLRGQPCGAFLGTTHGSAAYCEEYYRQIVVEGLEAANPLLFAEGVCNAAAAHLSIMLEITGACQAIIGSRTAGLDALRLASLRIRSGAWDCAIVGAADEYWPGVNRSYTQCGLYSGRPGTPFGEPMGFATGCGAVVLVVESRASAQRRNVEIKGVVGTGAAARAPDPHDAHHRIGLTAEVLGRIGAVPAVMASANCTSIDRLEMAALRQVAGPATPLTVSAIYGHVAECFSAMPLAAIAAVLLGGRLPPLVGGGAAGLAQRGEARQIQPAGGDEQPREFGVLCSDYAGGISAVRIGLPQKI